MNIKKIRKQKGLTQNDMCKRLGIGQSRYASWEKDEESLDYKKIKQCAKALGVKVWELLDDEDLPPDETGERIARYKAERDAERYSEVIDLAKKILATSLTSQNNKEQDDIQENTNTEETPCTKDGRRKYQITQYRSVRKHE